MVYFCCDFGSQESIDHLFYVCPGSNSIWKIFAGSAGICGPFLQVKYIVIKWWSVEVSHKLRPLYKALAMFILWQIWKRRYCIKHGGRMYVDAMKMEINRNVSYMARSMYPWIQNINNSWFELVQFLNDYTTRMGCRVVY